MIYFMSYKAPHHSTNIPICWCHPNKRHIIIETVFGEIFGDESSQVDRSRHPQGSGIYYALHASHNARCCTDNFPVFGVSSRESEIENAGRRAFATTGAIYRICYCNRAIPCPRVRVVTFGKSQRNIHTPTTITTIRYFETLFVARNQVISWLFI